MIYAIERQVELDLEHATITANVAIFDHPEGCEVELINWAWDGVPQDSELDMNLFDQIYDKAVKQYSESIYWG